MALWLRPQSAIRCQPQVAGFFDRIDYTSPGRRPRPIHGNVTFPASTRRRSKTCRDPFAASSMTAQSRCSATSLPPITDRHHQDGREDGPDGSRTGSQHSSLTQSRARPNFHPRSRNCCSRSKTGAIGTVGRPLRRARSRRLVTRSRCLRPKQDPRCLALEQRGTG